MIKGPHLSQRKMMVMKATTRSMRKLMVTPTKAAVSRQSASGEVKLTTTCSMRVKDVSLAYMFLKLKWNKYLKKV